MKIKLNMVMAAAALALVSATASATINVSSTPDLLFIAYDSSTQNTYTRDLGVSLSALSTNKTFSAPTASIFSGLFANAANIQWNVYALDNSTPTVYLTGALSKLGGLVDSDVAGTANVLTNSLGGLTQLDVAANGYIKPNGEYTGSTVGSDQTNGITFASNFGFGLPTSAKGVGTSMNLLKVDATGTPSQLFTNASLSAFNGNAKGGFFTLLDAQGDLQWTVSNVAAVPLPAAALLFAPGLLAMFGLGRRNKKLA